MCAQHDHTATADSPATITPDAITSHARCPNCGGRGSAPSSDSDCKPCGGSGHVSMEDAHEYLAHHLRSIDSLLALAADAGDSRCYVLYAAERLTVEAAVLSTDANGPLPNGAGAAAAIISDSFRELHCDLQVLHALHAAMWNTAEEDAEEAPELHAARLVARSLVERAEAAQAEAARLLGELGVELADHPFSVETDQRFRTEADRCRRVGLAPSR